MTGKLVVFQEQVLENSKASQTKRSLTLGYSP